MAALLQLSVHILCLLWLDSASAAGKLAATVTMMSSFHSMQLQSSTVQDMESMTLPDSLPGRSQYCPQQCTATCTIVPVNVCPSAYASTPYCMQSTFSLKQV